VEEGLPDRLIGNRD